jgi:hypothetical protein
VKFPGSLSNAEAVGERRREIVAFGVVVIGIFSWLLWRARPGLLRSARGPTSSPYWGSRRS